MIELFRTTQIAFFRFATPSRFLGRGGGGDEVEKVFVQGSVQGKIVWNHLWEHLFSVPDPRVFPPPEDRMYNWAAPKRGSPVMTETMFQTLVFTKTAGRQPGWGHCYLRSSQLHLACELACLRLRDSRDGWIEQSANTKIKGKETEESRGGGSRLKNSRFFFSKSVKKSVKRGARVLRAQSARASHACRACQAFCLTARPSSHMNKSKILRRIQR